MTKRSKEEKVAYMKNENLEAYKHQSMHGNIKSANYKRRRQMQSLNFKFKTIKDTTKL